MTAYREGEIGGQETKKEAHKPLKCVYGCACVHACINKRNIKVPRKFLLQFFPYCKIIGDFPFRPCGIEFTNISQ